MKQQQRSLCRSGAIAQILFWFLLTAVGTWALQLDGDPVWVGDNWNATLLRRNVEVHSYVRDSVVVSNDGGHICNLSAEGDIVEVAKSVITEKQLTNRTTESKESGLHPILDSAIPQVVRKKPGAKAVFGEPFQMRCPLDSSLPGILYYWQRYESIDMSREIGFPVDAEFHEEGRVWSVDVLSLDHNGMYECLAVNEMGEAVFYDTIDFFISVLPCSNHAPTLSFSIEPQGSSTHYNIGDRVELVCTVTAADYHEQPYWYHNGTTLCSSPTYQLENNFDKSTCQWRSVLIIPELTAETAGRYDCTFGEQGTNTTVLLADQKRWPFGVIEEVNVVGMVFVVLVLVLCCIMLCAKGTTTPQPTQEPPYDGFEYDAFVSAHDEAKDFVLERVLPPLESGPSPYRLCWHSRDFIPGVPVMEQISNAMEKSRRIIFVFSEHFSQSQFCTAELELAMTRYLKSCTRCILPVALGQGCVPEELRKRLTYLPVLSTTTTAGEEEEDVAGKIAKIMGEPIPVAMDRLNDSLIVEE